ncbi:MAG: UDP-N-acetylglucosamine 1-carboxyvinyltransferase [Planctomycetes bacterium]|nr:UDP-N-acetylglucosamine 1-carboxyvinyltransferase [Planctomycetota bacterium]
MTAQDADSGRKTMDTAPVTERQYKIEGGLPLVGQVTVAAAKNAIGKQLVASLLTTEPCVFVGVPRITEIDAILAMLADVGTTHVWLDRSTLWVHTPEIRSTAVGQRYSGFNRIPILLLGPLLHRARCVSVPLVGGCRIGPRPVDFHLAILRAMGAQIEQTDEGLRATCARLRGATVRLPYPSVGATENALLTAVLAVGRTTLENAALEPEVLDTIHFLVTMGAKIEVREGRRIIIDGVARLHGARHVPIGDRIEVASFAAAAVATDGRISVVGARPEPMRPFLDALRAIGGACDVEAGGLTFYRARRELTAAAIETDVYPGFATDWQQPLVVMLTQCAGVSTVHETVYEDRFGYVDALGRMGADIEVTSACLGSLPCRFRARGHLHSCRIRGATPLRGTRIEIPDLRAGFAYVLAALVAHGTSEVAGIAHLERGYADVAQKLQAIGAQFTVTEPAIAAQPSAAMSVSSQS